MRRLLGALLCLALWTSTAHAKALVIYHDGGGNQTVGSRNQRGLVGDLLYQTGGDYAAVPASQVTAGGVVQGLRRGKWFNGIDSTTYNPILVISFTPGANAPLDSLLGRVDYYPSVAFGVIANMGSDGFAQSAACTTGVGTFGNSTTDSSYVTYRVGSPGTRWVQENSGAACPVDASSTTRGFRPIWAVATSAHAFSMSGVYDDPLSGTYSTNPDTVCLWSVLNHASGVDAPLKGSTNQAVAVPITFGAPTYRYGYSGGEMSVYAAVLAAADSLSGGGLYPSTTRKLAKVSVHIDDGWKRGDSRNGGGVYGGIEVRDTTLMKASIDSLLALGVPFALGVEIDSLRTCWTDTTSSWTLCYTVGGLSPNLHTAEPRGGATAYILKFVGVTVGMTCSLRDSLGRFTTVTAVGADSMVELSARVSLTKGSSSWAVFWNASSMGNAMLYDGRWWARAPNAHYTPHCHAGTTTSAGQIQEYQPAAGPNWRMMDLWGTNQRTRIAWGGGTGLGQDSSLAYLHKRAFGLLDSTFGASRVDHVAMPPGDDWTPTYNSSTGIGNWPIPMTLDSLLFAWDFAGGRGIRNNSASNTSLVSQRLGSYGMYTGTMDYVVNLTATGATDRRGARGRFVSCPSYPTSASLLSYSRLSAGKGIRAFNSALNGHIFMVPDPSSTTNDQYAQAQIIAIHVSDLGGNPAGSPTRPGYYCIKYPFRASQAINALARQDMIRFVYPEDLIR